MTRFIATVRWLSRLSGVLAAAMLVAAVLVVCQLVVLRYGFGESIIWQTEFVIYDLVGATFLGSPYVLLTRGHVNVDLLPLRLKGRGRFLLALVASGLALAFCLIITWEAGRWWYEYFSEGWQSDTVWRVDLWIPYLAVPVGMGLLSLQYVADILALLSGRAPPFGIGSEEAP